MIVFVVYPILASQQSSCGDKKLPCFPKLSPTLHETFQLKLEASYVHTAVLTGEGNGNPLQYSCLENPVDRGAWWAAVYGITQSRAQLKWLSMHACIGEGNGNPLQYSCLENPVDRGAWWAAVCGVTQSQAQLKWLSMRECIGEGNGNPLLPGESQGRKSLVGCRLWGRTESHEWNDLAAAAAAILTMDNQQGPIIEHRVLCSVLCGSLDGNGVWGRVDTYMCVAESLHCTWNYHNVVNQLCVCMLIRFSPVQLLGTHGP